MRRLSVVAARDLGAQFTSNPHRMVGQDGAYSIPLGDGTALWFFGDTLMGARVPNESLWFPGGQPLGPGDMSGHGGIEKLQNNTALLLSDKTGRNGLRNFSYLCDQAGVPRQLIPHVDGEHPDETRVWCLHGVTLVDTVYLYYLTVRMLAEGPLPVNFELIGSGLAKGKRGTFEFERIRHEGKTIWWGDDIPKYGTTVLRAGDGWLYVYGVINGKDGVQRCHVARVREELIAQPASYEYFDGASWSNEARAAAPVMTGMPNEMSVSWNPHLGAYLAVHSLDLSGKIVGRTSPNPWGPWSDPVTLWQCVAAPLTYEIPSFRLIYAGKEHPELAEDRGRVLYLTYIEFEEYFPHLVEVTIE